MMKMLIVYYSWSNGNTAKIAEQLQRATGADIARIETVKPYEGSYMEVVDQGQREVQEGFKPAIRSLAYDPPIMTSLPSGRRRGGTRWPRR